MDVRHKREAEPHFPHFAMADLISSHAQKSENALSNMPVIAQPGHYDDANIIKKFNNHIMKLAQTSGNYY